MSRYQAQSRFHFVLSMQRYEMLSNSELQEVEFLFQVCHNLTIAYISTSKLDDGVEFHACMRDRDGVKFRIKLPGNPFLGDGKSDNQNIGFFFTRGDFVQLIDSNQEHYVEECAKVFHVLAEFKHNP